MARENKGNREVRRAAMAMAASEQSITVHRSQELSGPLPSPDVLAGYERIMPGVADRIVKMAESEVIHRQSMETAAITAQAKDIAASRIEVRFGQIAALIIGLTGLISGTVAAIHGYPWIGGIEGGGTVVSLVSAFLYRQHIVSKTPKEASKPHADKDEIAIPPLLTRDENSA